jgi:hypothetical protein
MLRGYSVRWCREKEKVRARVRVRKEAHSPELTRAELTCEPDRLRLPAPLSRLSTVNETTISSSPFPPPPPSPSPLSKPMPAPYTSHVPQHPLPSLYLYPLNDSFIPKHIHLPQGQRIKIGRQTNAKTAPGERNGFFDSKVLSRQHAEVWEDAGKVRPCPCSPALSLSPSSPSTLDLYQRRQELKRYLHKR